MATIKNDRDNILQAAPYRLADTLVTVTSTTGTFRTPKNGALTVPSSVTLTATPNTVFTEAAVYTWHYALNTTPTTWVLLGTGLTIVRTSAQYLAMLGTATEITFRCMATENLLTTAYGFYTIGYSIEASDPIVVDISRAISSILCDSIGTPLSFSNTDATISVTRGVPLTYSAVGGANTFSVSIVSDNTPRTLGTISTTSTTYTLNSITAITVDVASVVFIVTIYDAAGVAVSPTVAKQITYTKVTKGVSGGDATYYYINTTSPVITKSTSSALISGTHSVITVRGKKVVGGADPINFGYITITGNGATEAALATSSATGITTTINNTDGETSYIIKMYNQATVSGATLLDTMTIPVLFTGSSAVTGTLTNDTASVPTNAAGSAAIYDNTGTDIYVYQGTQILTYDGVGTAAGTWKILSTSSSNITIGTITDQGTFARVGISTNLIAQTAYTTYNISGTTLEGGAFTLSKTQTFNRAPSGVAGDNGTSVFTLQLYTKSVVAQPVDGAVTYTISSGVLGGTPGSWQLALPATDTTPTYMTSAVLYTTATTNPTTANGWTTPIIVAQSGTNGNNGATTRLVELYKASAAPPGVPTNNTISYTVSTNSMTDSATSGWSLSMPTVGAIPVYMTTAVLSTTTPTVAVSMVAWTSAVLVAQNGLDGNAGISTRTIELFSTTTTSLPTGLTYTISTDTLSGTYTGWSRTMPATTTLPTYYTAVTVSTTTPTIAKATGTWSTAIIVAQNGAPGATGASVQLVEIFKSSNSGVPVVPGVNATSYIMSTNTFSGTVNGWSTNMPTVTTDPMYMSTTLVSTTTPASPYTIASWSSPVIVAQNGTHGTKSTTISAFKWGTSIGTYTQAVTYTWSGGGVSAYPAGWSASAPASTATGQTLYQLNLTITDIATSISTVANWSTAVTNQVGYRQDGSIGLTGNSARVAYIVNTSSTPPASPTSLVGDQAPTGWSFTATAVLSAGQYMYQVDGILTTGGNIAWGIPYLSNLKVGSLSALSANLGTVSISTVGSLSSTGKTYGNTTSGVFLGYSGSAYKFDVGNGTNYLRWNGSNLSMSGSVTATSGSFTGSIYANAGYLRGLDIEDSAGNVILSAGSTLASQLSANLLDTSTWVTNTHDGTGVFVANGGFYEQYRRTTSLPDGTIGTTWFCYPGLYYNNAYGWDDPRPGGVAAGDADGGWNTTLFKINNARGYRFAVWVRRTAGTVGEFYFGCGANSVYNMGTTVKHGNPYFYSVGINALLQDRWYLAVGYVYPTGESGVAQRNMSGIYDGVTGQKVGSGTDYVWAVDAVETKQRVYLYYSAPGNHIEFVWPRVEMMNGAEPSLAQLLSTGSVSGRNPITLNNISTYIDGAAIGNAQINGNIYSENYYPSGGTAGWLLDRAGNLTAKTGTFSGDITGASGAFSGTLSASAVNAVNTINIAGNAVSIMATATGVSTASTSVSIPAGGTLRLAVMVTYAQYGYMSSSPGPTPISFSIDGTTADSSYQITSVHNAVSELGQEYGAAAVTLCKNVTIYSASARSIPISATGGGTKTIVAIGTFR